MIDEILLERVFKNIQKSKSGCWIWKGYKDPKGYGRISIKNIPVLVHRLIFEHYNGELNSKLEVCHECNNAYCVNPEHLRQDTKSSNMIDMVKIKKQHSQKLTVLEVLEIKKKLKSNYRGIVKDLAKEYNVSRYAITDIKIGKSWSWLDIT
jgi:hypothetical protein